MAQYVKSNVENLQSLLDYMYFKRGNTTGKASYSDKECTKVVVGAGTYRSISAVYDILQSHIPNYNKEIFKSQILTVTGFSFQICDDLQNLTLYGGSFSGNLRVNLKNYITKRADLEPLYPHIYNIIDKFNLNDIK